MKFPDNSLFASSLFNNDFLSELINFNREIIFPFQECLSSFEIEIEGSNVCSKMAHQKSFVYLREFVSNLGLNCDTIAANGRLCCARACAFDILLVVVPISRAIT